MKLKFMLLSMFMFATSCASVDSIKKSPTCIVWKDQKYFGPYSTEVNDKKVYWNGACTGGRWKCRTVEVSFDENKNIMIGETSIGKIEGMNFNSSVKMESADQKMTILYTALRVYPDLKQVHASVSGADVTDQTIYHYNDKCSSDQAIIGGIALGMIAEIQIKK